MPAISLEDAKAHLRVRHSEEDALITSMIKTAIECVEGETGHLFEQRTVVETFSSFGEIRLQSWPIASIDAIEYVGADYLTSTLETDEIQLATNIRPARLYRYNRAAWPDLADEGGSVSVTLTAGYETPGEIKQRLLQAALFILGDFYLQRETFVIGAPASEVPLAMPIKRLLSPFRIMTL